MNHLLETEADDPTHKKSIMRRIISNILVNDRFILMPSVKGIPRIIGEADISSGIYAWLQTNSQNSTFNPVNELLNELSNKLGTAI